MERSVNYYRALHDYNHLEKPEHSDITIICGRRRWNVHGVVVFPRSPVLQRQWSEQLQFKAPGHPPDRRIRLAGSTIDTLTDHVNVMIQYMYAQAYPTHEDEIRKIQTNQELSPLCFHVIMCILSDRYKVEALYKEAYRAFQETLAVANRPQQLDKAIEHAFRTDGLGCPFRVQVGLVSRSVDFTWSDHLQAFTHLVSTYPVFASSLACAQNRRLVDSRLELVVDDLYRCGICETCFTAKEPREKVGCFFACLKCGTEYYGSTWLKDYLIRGARAAKEAEPGGSEQSASGLASGGTDAVKSEL